MEASFQKLFFRKKRFRFLEWLNGSGLRAEQPENWIWYKLSWKRRKLGGVCQALSRHGLFLAGAARNVLVDYREGLRPFQFNNSRNQNLVLRKSSFWIPASIESFVPCMFGSCEVPVNIFQLFGSRKICISFGILEDENGKTESWRNTYRGVDLEKMRFVPEWFSCTNSPTSCMRRKYVSVLIVHVLNVHLGVWSAGVEKTI